MTALFLFLFAVLTNSLLAWTGKVYNFRLDQYAYQFDRAFGQPSFVLGRMMQQHRWLDLTLRSGYSLMFSAMLILISAYFLLRPLEEAIRVVRTMFAGLLGLALSISVPISGPKYAFLDFPNAEPRVLMLKPLHLTAPPNGFPSLHMTIALLILYFGRRWKTGVVLGAIYVLLIASSTLGTGEHYLLDLIAAFPFTVLVIWLGSGTTDRMEGKLETVTGTSSKVKGF